MYYKYLLLSLFSGVYILRY